MRPACDGRWRAPLFSTYTLTLAVLAVVTTTLVSELLRGAADAPILAQAFVLMALAIGWWSALYYLAYEVTLRDDGTVEFRTAVRRVRTDVSRIESVKGGSSIGRPLAITISFGGREIYLIRQLKGLDLFVSKIRAQNPAIEVTGKL